MGTMTRSVRWRIRDLASCFWTSCALGIADEGGGNRRGYRSSNTNYLSSIGKRKKMDRHKINRSSKRLCRGNRERARRVSDTSQIEDADRNSTTVATSGSNRPNFSEEDYIVFCISKDGAIDLSNDRTTEAPQVRETSGGTSCPDIQKVRVSSDGSRTARVHDCCSNDDSQTRNKADRCTEEAAQTEEKERDLLPEQSRSSNSSSSFSFPEDRLLHPSQYSLMRWATMGARGRRSSPHPSHDVRRNYPTFRLKCEWIGSPAQMPKTEDQNGSRMSRVWSTSGRCP